MQNIEDLSSSHSIDHPVFPPPLPETSHPVRLGRIQKFSFHGNGLEYFGIWIVNLLLMIVTLGLYSPWAKVRRLRYFYSNTALIQRRFDFTGVPTKILKGRLIALGIYLAISILSKQSWEWMLAGALVIWLAVPWLVRATLRFNARNSKFSNARFFFDGTHKAAYGIFFMSIFLMIITLGLAFPIVLWMYKKYTFNNLQLGQLKFNFKATWLNFVVAMYIPIIVYIGILVLGLTMGRLPSLDLIRTSPEILMRFAGLMMFFYVAALFVIWPWIQARLFISTWNNMVLSRSKFQTSCNSAVFVWIMVTNWLLKIVSFGLLTPWAAVRIYRYKVESLSLCLVNDPDLMLNQMQEDPSAIAEELSDIFDFDISL
ncbi:hypothetical protein A3K93_02355 [Acinetobacter sp. NCu2D-2]|uniref:YjgN family protein n=1 Tax=Acinetobacter sp. NCu2D-2 TaxID=1608473 RepID=UPI0007CDB0C4|nr:YjgN family protein [Acinetobacter sp. NCu2D-2]ANF81144.1 hypothetical protein A3K93_02355 [Acinetobacter sp. NCu2D-2]